MLPETGKLGPKRQAQAQRLAVMAQAMDVEILAHFYQRAEVKALAGFVGGSAGLYRAALESKARALMICGVEFLAQAIGRLRPDLPILVPRRDAGCPFSQTVGPGEVDLLRREHPGCLLVADLKASGPVRDLCDLSLDVPGGWPVSAAGETVLVLPALSAGNPAAMDHMGWPGALCQVHFQITAGEVEETLRALPGARLAVNSLCRPEVRRMADFVGDSQSIHDYCRRAPRGEYLIVCESGLAESLRLSFPEGRFLETETEIFCPNMKLTNIKDMLACLEALGGARAAGTGQEIAAEAGR
ncbi:MAG: quinolinate synthase NadA [Deltaproteobacteria bacterium]|nr:quinolinate synthase NadA [Deltaproteobacteria bacterium]